MNKIARFACKYNFEWIIKLINFDINYQDKEGNTLLMISAWTYSESIVKLLIKKGANLDITNNEGYTAARFAEFINRGHIVELLINEGADANIQDTEGNTLLIQLCKKKNEDRILFAYEHGANFYLKNNLGESSLDILEKQLELSGKLQSLKEKILLEQFVSDASYQAHGL